VKFLMKPHMRGSARGKASLQTKTRTEDSCDITIKVSRRKSNAADGLSEQLKQAQGT
jgi:hypothetical protein